MKSKLNNNDNFLNNIPITNNKIKSSLQNFNHPDITLMFNSKKQKNIKDSKNSIKNFIKYLTRHSYETFDRTFKISNITHSFSPKAKRTRT